LQVDKFALDALNENAEVYMQNLEQWITVCTNRQLTIFLINRNLYKEKKFSSIG
jgi:hypothetical protein